MSCGFLIWCNIVRLRQNLAATAANLSLWLRRASAGLDAIVAGIFLALRSLVLPASLRLQRGF